MLKIGFVLIFVFYFSCISISSFWILFRGFYYKIHVDLQSYRQLAWLAVLVLENLEVIPAEEL